MNMNNTLKPRLMMTKTQSNILMTQIRAEKKRFETRNQPIFICSHRDETRTGKKVFKQHLYHTTVLYRQPQHSRERSNHSRFSRTPPKSKGKKTGYEQSHCQLKSPQKHGKRRALQPKFINCQLSDMLSFDPKRPIDMSPIKFSKRRYDQSPNNQNRLSPGFNLFGARR